MQLRTAGERGTNRRELLSIEKPVDGKVYDFVFMHTRPFSKFPTEVFLSGVVQNKVLNRTEKALERIMNGIIFDRWFCGHYHTDKTDGKVESFFHSIKGIV
ncbi:MAG: hypothetical protein LBP26_06155 [Clostridiales bacterium]|nr:hypothetical protein [Clostridiales bacterium]